MSDDITPEARERFMQIAAQFPVDPGTDYRAESLRDFMESWYARWAGPGEAWNFRDLAESIVEDWLPDVSTQPTPGVGPVELPLCAGWTLGLRREGGHIYLDWHRTGSQDPHLPHLSPDEAVDLANALLALAPDGESA